MRAFNERERLIIEKIASIEANSVQTCTKFLQDIFFTVEKKMALILSHESNNAWFYIDPDLMLKGEDIRRKNHELFELLILLSYLKENRYIAIVSPSNKKEKYEILYSGADSFVFKGDRLSLGTKGDYILTSNLDEIRNSKNELILKGGQLYEYYDFIYSNMFGLIFPSEELKELVKHKFKTREDRKHIQNLWASWIGISLALLLGLFGIWNPFDSNHEETEKINKGIENVSLKLENLNQLNSNSLNTLKSIDNNTKSVETDKNIKK